MERSQEIRECFDAMIALPEIERAAALDELRSQDAVLCAEIESLLKNARAWDLLETPAVPPVSGLLDSSPSDIGTVPLGFPGYKVTRVLGEGGMGLVYEAEQLHPNRRVALKVLRPSLVTPGSLRRFEKESELLARLNHSGIAAVYEVGMYETGGASQPFFAMEYVDGAGLLEHADQRALGVRERVSLLAKVCDAVGHAHSRGIVHRDLKPSNIMVTTDGVVKVLDFGIARTTNPDTMLATMRTESGALIGTLSYMSPEQLSGETGEIDYRSDVFSLGAIAYELLSGRRLYESSSTSFPDAVIAIRQAQQSQIGTVSRDLTGEIATIVMTAISAEPARRYADAASLSDDLRRYLRNEPITARPPTTAYILSKLISRHKAFVWSVGCVLLVLIGGSVATGLGLIRATRAESAMQLSMTEALSQAAIAKAINDFLNEDILSAADPTRATSPDITMREVLDRASERIEGQFADEPEVEAAIRLTLAQAFERLGSANAAEPHWRRAAHLQIAPNGEPTSDSVRAMASLGTNLMNQGRFNDAIDVIQNNLEFQESMEEPDPDEILRTKSNLAVAHLQIGRLAEAAPILVETLDGKRAALGDLDPSTLTSINNLAGLYISLDQPADAEPLYREAYRGRLEVLGKADPRTLTTMSALAWALTDLEQYDEAESLLRDAMIIMDQRLDAGHPIRLRAVNALGNTYFQAGRFEEAEKQFSEAAHLREQFLGLAHLETLLTIFNLAETRLTLGRAEDAKALYTRMLAQDESSLPDDHWARGDAHIGLGLCMEQIGEMKGVEPILIEGVRRVLQSLGASHPKYIAAREKVGEFYDRQGRPEAAVLIRDCATLEDLSSIVEQH
tara:strand:- start:140720 stop:143269 length:2550 start_codon:yes stop_codon:yes gene_type:complete